VIDTVLKYRARIMAPVAPSPGIGCPRPLQCTPLTTIHVEVKVEDVDSKAAETISKLTVTASARFFDRDVVTTGAAAALA
jgi:hypothetical protein